MGQTQSKKQLTNEQIKFAVTGRSATGKSTCINTIRNFKPGDDDFTKAGSGDMTLTPMLYIHPTNDQIAFYEIPGYSSTTFEKEAYISKLMIHRYDFVFIIFNDALSEDEIWLAGALSRLGTPFSFVRSKIDIEIDNAIYDGNNQEMVIPEIKGRIRIALHANPELKDTKSIFLISSRHRDLGEMSDLITYVEEHINGLKLRRFFFSLGSITNKIV